MIGGTVCRLHCGTGTTDYQVHWIYVGVTSTPGSFPAGSVITWTVSDLHRRGGSGAQLHPQHHLDAERQRFGDDQTLCPGGTPTPLRRRVPHRVSAPPLSAAEYTQLPCHRAGGAPITTIL